VDEVDEMAFAGKEMAITPYLSVEEGTGSNAKRGNKDGESTLFRRLR
jgi:hypothetical protein